MIEYRPSFECSCGHVNRFDIGELDGTERFCEDCDESLGELSCSEGQQNTAVAIRLCTFRSEPGEHECREACWSAGRACKTCPVECYRAGWSKERVDRDNAELVNATGKERS